MSATNPETLFDVPLELDRPIEELWAEAEPFMSSKTQSAKRLHRAGDLVLREHELSDFQMSAFPSSLETIEELQETISIAHRHFDWLRSFGMRIVSCTTEIRPIFTTLPLEDEFMPIAYSASKFVADCKVLDEPEPDWIPYEKIEESIVKPLESYRKFCNETKTSHMLVDVYDPPQYALKTSSGTVFLHDIDPFVAPEHDLYPDWTWDED